MQLTTYISDLLFRYECVIIPGFGAFLTHRHSAWIDPETDTFHPPFKKVTFNRQLQTNDGLVANYLASMESISYEEALHKLRVFSAQINMDLQYGRQVVFPTIGEFVALEEGKIQFKADKKGNFSTDSFGLDSFILPKIKREVSTSLSEVSQENEPVVLHRTPRTTYFKYAAAAAVALLIGGIGGLKWQTLEVEKQNLAERQKAASLIENKIQEATFVIDNPLPAINLRVSKQRGAFHIVAGAYKEEENAHKKIAQLKEKGYHSISIPTKHGLHQVIYDSFENKRDAINKLHAIQKTENADAWLLIKELD